MFQWAGVWTGTWVKKQLKKVITGECDVVKEEVNEKKNVFFQALPEFPKPPPPPHDPNSGNLVLFLRKSKFKILKSV